MKTAGILGSVINLTNRRAGEIDMRPTLKDVAKKAGVNFTLVSKYINGNPQARMTPETRDRIDSAIRELNYRPSASARALRIGRSRTVGMISGDLTNAYCAHFADLTLRVLKERDYQLLLALDGSGEKGEALQSLLAREVDGIILPQGDESKLPCPAVAADCHSKFFSTINPDIAQPLQQALSGISGRVSGIFFPHSLWQEEFERAARCSGVTNDSVCLSLKRELRLGELRKLCATRPDYFITSGWETLTMLLELLDAEFPDYTPHILLHANCTGPFLNDRRMAGVIYSSTTQLVREMCDVLIDRIENPGAPLEERRLPSHYIPAGTPEYAQLVSRKFRLT